MKMIQIFELIICHLRKCRVKEESGSKMLCLFTFCLWFSTTLGGRYDSHENSYYFSKNADKYKENKECALDITSYLHNFNANCLKLLAGCFNVAYDSAAMLPLDDDNFPSKRAVIHKNVAYLLLKLHPLFNKTSQLDFSTSGRLRRVADNIGTEFLGKRSFLNEDILYHPVPFKSDFGKKLNFILTNKLSDPEPLKRFGNGLGYKEWIIKVFGKRMGNADNEKIKVLLGNQITRLDGSELLGKRRKPPLEGSEFLGKRGDK